MKLLLILSFTILSTFSVYATDHTWYRTSDPYCKIHFLLKDGGLIEPYTLINSEVSGLGTQNLSECKEIAQMFLRSALRQTGIQPWINMKIEFSHTNDFSETIYNAIITKDKAQEFAHSY